MNHFDDFGFRLGHDLAESKLAEIQKLYGEIRINKIKAKVSNSKTLKEIIYLSLSQKATPSGDDFVAAVMNNLTFAFAKPDIICAGALISILEWDSKANSKNELFNVLEFSKVVVQIIDRCERMKFK